MLFWSIIIDSRQNCRSTDRDGLSSATDEEVPLFFVESGINTIYIPAFRFTAPSFIYFLNRLHRYRSKR